MKVQNTCAKTKFFESSSVNKIIYALQFDVRTIIKDVSFLYSQKKQK